jgi:hypothetical protein
MATHPRHAQSGMAQTPISLTPAAELGIHIDALTKQDRLLLQQQIELERKGVIAEEPRPGVTVADRVVHWMNGYASAANAGVPDAQRLHSILIDRAAIERALSSLEQQRSQAMAVEAQAAAVAATPAWLALIRRTTLAAELLKSLEAEVIAMRQTKGGMFLPHSEYFGHRSILNVHWGSDPASRVRDTMLKAGV